MERESQETWDAVREGRKFKEKSKRENHLSSRREQALPILNWVTESKKGHYRSRNWKRVNFQRRVGETRKREEVAWSLDRRGRKKAQNWDEKMGEKDSDQRVKIGRIE